jgi:riboflavin synthase
MFTGIVTGMGRVVRAASSERAGDSRRLEVEPPRGFGRLAAGESVCVSGVCLTAVASGRRLVADLSGETLRRSTLGGLAEGDVVNLERALRFGDRLSGHFVMGHVDAVARLLGCRMDGSSWTLRVAIPVGLSGLVAEKGSVALDGVSLTVASRSAREFTVAIIPETRRRTTLGRAEPGARLNLEADIFARYGREGALKRLRGAARERPGRRS